jgi:hypothetical protein
MKQSFKDMAQRFVNAENRFTDYVKQATGTDDATAHKVLAYYRQHKIVKLDAVSGTFSVPHGALLDAATLRNCIELVAA